MSVLLLPESDDLPNNPRRRRASLRSWLLLAPVLLWLVLFVLVPTLTLVVVSFCGRDSLGQVVYHFSFQNYARSFSPIFLKILGVSLWYAFLATALCVLLGYPVAYFIARLPQRYRNILLTLVIIPFWANFLLRTYAWISILSNEGLLNGLLQSAGLISSPLQIMFTPFSVVLGLVYNYLPFMILPIYVSVEKLGPEVIEAAFDLGAKPWRAFWSVILPLTKTGIMGGVLMVFVPAIAMFAIANLMGGGVVPTLGDVIQKQFTSGRNPGFGAAMGTILLALFFLALSFTQRKPASQAKD